MLMPVMIKSKPNKIRKISLFKGKKDKNSTHNNPPMIEKEANIKDNLRFVLFCFK